MDMKRILQSLDTAASKPAVAVGNMRHFVSIVAESNVAESTGPLNRLTAAEAIAVNHYTKEKRTDATSPVLNVREGATPSMIGKYFKKIEQEFAESEERKYDRARQLAEVVSKNVNEKAKSLKTSNPCWSGYHPVGTKQKAGRSVPNCVPTESVSAQQAATAISIKKAGKKPNNK